MRRIQQKILAKWRNQYVRLLYTMRLVISKICSTSIFLIELHFALISVSLWVVQWFFFSIYFSTKYVVINYSLQLRFDYGAFFTYLFSLCWEVGPHRLELWIVRTSTRTYHARSGTAKNWKEKKSYNWQLSCRPISLKVRILCPMQDKEEHFTAQ